MSNKILFLGILTIIGFPLIGFGLRYFIEGISIWSFLNIHSASCISIGYGLEFGVIYAFMAMILMNSPVFDGLNHKMQNIVKSMKLTYGQGIFLSICAGIGEEYLFRMGIQPYLGIWITSIGFIALHGYLNPFNWRFSLYGLIALPFILLISYGYESFGIFFAISAHFSYDAILFTAMISSKDTN